MAASILWYDYETFGVNARQDRPAQFAAVRTDLDLNPIGDPIILYCKPSNDFLPHPEACLITGITPQIALEKGLPEVEFFKQIKQMMCEPDTTIAGYNSISFDSEVTRFGNYRNFFDAYEHEWRNGNSRWDLMNILRAAAVFLPDKMVWPKNAQGRPSFKLTDLTTANGIQHDDAHDALSDVYATIGLARLLKKERPTFYQFMFNIRTKQGAANHLQIGKPICHVSQSYGSDRAYMSKVVPIMTHPTNKNALIAYDLGSVDQLDWLSDEPTLTKLTATEIKERLYAKQADLDTLNLSRIPLITIQINQCPTLVPVDALTERVASRLSIDAQQWDCNHTALIEFQKKHPMKYANMLSKLHAVFSEKAEPETDPELMLYNDFVSDNGKRMAAKIHQTAPENLASLHKGFISESQFPELLFRFRARHFPNTLSTDEHARWDAYRLDRIDRLTPNYASILEEALATRLNNPDLSETEKQRAQQIIDALKHYASEITDTAKFSQTRDLDASNPQTLTVIADRYGIEPNALIHFVDTTVTRLILDTDQLTHLFLPLALHWKERAQKEWNLMQDLIPMLKALADDQTVSGLAPYTEAVIPSVDKLEPPPPLILLPPLRFNITLVEVKSSPEKLIQLLYVNDQAVFCKKTTHDQLFSIAERLSEIVNHQPDQLLRVDLTDEVMDANKADIPAIKLYADHYMSNYDKQLGHTPSDDSIDLTLLTGTCHAGAFRRLVLNNQILLDENDKINTQSIHRLADALSVELTLLDCHYPDLNYSDAIKKANLLYNATVAQNANLADQDTDYSPSF